jgi:hypothetical protein
MRAEFPSSIDPKPKYLDRYTVWDVLRTLLLSGGGWYIANDVGAAGGIALGVMLAEVKPDGKPLDRHILSTVHQATNPPKVSSPGVAQFIDDSVVLLDDSTVLAVIRVSSHDIEYASQTDTKANIGAVRELFDELDNRIEIHSCQRQVDVSIPTDGVNSAVTTDHYVLIKEADGSVKHNLHSVTSRCRQIQNLLTAGDLYAEQVTGDQLQSAVKQLYPGKTTIAGRQYTTSSGEAHVCRMLYVDEYPEQLPIGWIAQILDADHQGLVDVVQTASPISETQRDWMDRMVARTKSELSSSRKPSRQAGLRRQRQDLEDLIEVDTSGETLVNYGVYIVARGDSTAEATKTLESLKSELKRIRIDAREPRHMNQGFKRVSAFHRSRFSRTEIVPGHSAASGFSFATSDTMQPGGVLFGTRKNGKPVLLNRFSWESGHTTIMGKIGSGKTYWTKLNLLRLYRALDDVQILVVDPKKRDYGPLIQALDGESVIVDTGLGAVDNDVVRYTVDDPSRDNSETLAETVRHVYQQAAKTDRKTLVVVDEVHRIITKGDSIYQNGLQAVSTLIRESRDRNVAATLVSQNADEFTRSNEGQNILRNTDCNLFFKQNSVDTKVSDFFQLSESTNVELRKLRTGTELRFSEAFITGPVTTRLRIDSTDAEHQLIEHGDRLESPNHYSKQTQKTDGGKAPQTDDETTSSVEQGFLKLAGLVSSAPIGVFEYLLLAGFPVATVLYLEELLKPTFQVDGLPLNGTLIDIVAIWTAVMLVLEMAWILVLTTSYSLKHHGD